MIKFPTTFQQSFQLWVIYGLHDMQSPNWVGAQVRAQPSRPIPKQKSFSSRSLVWRSDTCLWRVR
jgi:hypothetical protein